ncbi:hypothetical protein GCM10010234_11600 [Streptomyces hawaiiensis]
MLGHTPVRKGPRRAGCAEAGSALRGRPGAGSRMGWRHVRRAVRHEAAGRLTQGAKAHGGQAAAIGVMGSRTLSPAGIGIFAGVTPAPDGGSGTVGPPSRSATLP